MANRGKAGKAAKRPLMCVAYRQPAHVNLGTRQPGLGTRVSVCVGRRLQKSVDADRLLWQPDAKDRSEQSQQA